MKKFEFLRDMQRYDGMEKIWEGWLEKRHTFLIDPFKDYLQGATVLDIAAHDGRSSYALAAAGADPALIPCPVTKREQPISGFMFCVRGLNLRYQTDKSPPMSGARCNNPYQGASYW